LVEYQAIYFFEEGARGLGVTPRSASAVATQRRRCG
jgi:hypothetical protein